METSTLQPEASSYETVKETARQVLVEMGKRRIPLTPENYHVWFYYATKRNPELVAEVERIAQNGMAFSDAVNRDIYDRYISPKGVREQVQKAQDDTQDLLKQILSEVIQASSSAAEYGHKFADYSQRISKAHGVQEIQQVVKSLLHDTAQLADTSHGLQERLKDATAEAQKLRRSLTEAKRDALVDELTQLNNRKALNAQIEMLVQRFNKSQMPFTAVMMDVDHFKRFNDVHGHETGDEVLRTLGAVMNQHVQGPGFPARYGGEEFSILLPHKSLEEARQVAEHLRQMISELEIVSPVTRERIGNLTASFGIAAMGKGDTTLTLLKRADKALYLAKESGRNNVKTEVDFPKD